MQVLSERLVMVPVGDLKAHPDNPRRSDVDFIEGLIQANGFFGALVVQQATNFILVGNHRWQAAQKAGIEEVPVLYADVDDAHALRILLSENRANDLGTYDYERLGDLVAALPDLDGTGWAEGDITDEILEFPPEGVQPDPPRADTPPPPPGSHLREVVVMVPEELFEQAMNWIKDLAEHYGTSGTVATVFEAVRRQAEDFDG